MDEFRKPYEYDEDKGINGLLMVYFFLLIVEEVILGIIAFFFGYSRLPENRWFGVIIWLAVFYIVFALFSAIILRCEKKFAIKVSKAFLIFRFLFLVPFLFLHTNIRIAEIPYEVGHEMYERAYNSIISTSIISMAYIVAFSVCWYIYFLKSKKVKELFPDNASSSKAAVQ